MSHLSPSTVSLEARKLDGKPLEFSRRCPARSNADLVEKATRIVHDAGLLKNEVCGPNREIADGAPDRFKTIGATGFPHVAVGATGVPH